MSVILCRRIGSLLLINNHMYLFLDDWDSKQYWWSIIELSVLPLSCPILDLNSGLVTAESVPIVGRRARAPAWRVLLVAVGERQDGGVVQCWGGRPAFVRQRVFQLHNFPTFYSQISWICILGHGMGWYSGAKILWLYVMVCDASPKYFG